MYKTPWAEELTSTYVNSLCGLVNNSSGHPAQKVSPCFIVMVFMYLKGLSQDHAFHF